MKKGKYGEIGGPEKESIDSLGVILLLITDY